jgi:hypothetical protein
MLGNGKGKQRLRGNDITIIIADWTPNLKIPVFKCR